MADLGLLSIEIRASLKDFELAMNGVSKKLDSVSKDFESSNNKIAESFSVIDIAIGNLIAQGISKLSQEIIEFGKLGIKTAGDLESHRMGFKTLLGSIEEADKAILMIQEDAKKTPFEFQGLVEANKQ